MTTLLITILILAFVNWVLPERQTPESVTSLILIVVTVNLILTAYPIVKRLPGRLRRIAWIWKWTILSRYDSLVSRIHRVVQTFAPEWQYDPTCKECQGTGERPRGYWNPPMYMPCECFSRKPKKVQA